MKICPICNTEYNDEINFCKQDGTPLVNKCPKCGMKNPSDAAFCMACGSKLVSKSICLNCGAELPEEAVFCIKCGTKVVVVKTVPQKDISQKAVPENDVSKDFVLVEGNGTVKDFYICKYEVTQKLYESVMGTNPSHFKGEYRPVEKVSWYDAVEFCNKLSEKEGLTPCYSGNGENTKCDFKANGYRLPTEAEWEYAAKGGNKSKGYTYAGSNNIDEVAWYDENSNNETHPVGQKKENELGLFDMSGNVCEWCWNSNNSWHYYRGGSWRYDGCYCERTVRFSTDLVYIYLGFRLVRTAK